MKYEVKPMKEICYVDNDVVDNFSLSYEDAEPDEAHVFSVHERESDGCLRWIADFGNRTEAEKWKAVMEKEGGSYER
jgi:hypothetical protein